MNWLNVFGIAVALAMDATAVSIAAGLTIAKPASKDMFRMSLHFGLFQFFMPIIGWSIGRFLTELISNYDHWAAFVLLLFIGGKMIWDSKTAKDDSIKKDTTKGWTLIALSVATSIDALAVGISFAMLKTPILASSIVIGITAFVLSLAGIILGSKIGKVIGEKIEKEVELIGGLILILIGAKILFEHLIS